MKDFECIILILIILIVLIFIFNNGGNCKKENFDASSYVLPTQVLAKTSTLENPDFFAEFGSFTSSSLFTKDGWTLGSSVGTYGNEGLASILTNNNNPIAHVSQHYSYPRAVGFLSNSLFLQIGVPSPQVLKSLDWYGSCSVHGCARNAKNIRLWASNNNYYNNWQKIRQEAILRGEFTIDKNSSSTNPTKVNLLNNPTPFSFYYFDILDSWGDLSVKIDRIKLNLV